MDSPTISASKRRGRKELFFEKLPFLRAHEKGDSTNDSLQPLEIPATTPHPPKNGVVWGGMLKKTPPSFTHHKGKQRRCLHKIFSLSFFSRFVRFWGRKGKYCDHAGRRSVCVKSCSKSEADDAAFPNFGKKERNPLSEKWMWLFFAAQFGE